jgi:hypothetical protein
MGEIGGSKRRGADDAPRRYTGGLMLRPRIALVVASVTWTLSMPADLARSQESAAPARLAQTGHADTGHADSVRITVAPTISAGPASKAALSIRVAPADGLPRNAFVRVSGLPPAVSLSEGYATAPGAWSVPLRALSSLQMNVPVGVVGRTELSISLVGEDGTPLADARTTLIVEAPPQRQESKAQTSPPQAAAAAQPPLPPPAHPRAPILSPTDREAAERFVARGEHEIEQGQIAVARNFFLRAAQAGLARGALLLAATYDPRELARWHVQGVQPNLKEARKWYERARELGAPEAEERLARLGAG